MTLQNILLVINLLVCIAMIFTVLLQRSEGGALGMGGGPSGFMSVRGAGDFLTRTTWILFGIFLTLSLVLTLMGGGGGSVTDRMKVQGLDPTHMGQTLGAGANAAVPPSTETTPIPDLQPGAPAAPPLTAPAPALNTAPTSTAPARPAAARPATRPTAQPAAPAPVAAAPAPAPVIEAPPPPAAPATQSAPANP